ncbi:Citrate lyase beta subunit [Hahella chejuensis KCTC 2396]|uniref:Citrate lyase beta subunit n=1 Tax=Hahella chejuensis (strain KCTC 2396) TaxID=349521 RepID=Q2SGF5_HAHCH|nr:CoA ester lyase [Hahella chejuensis]ABC30269.1 Citrate lyase beta subunit [Hahella chejuensis KCTC 2396]
MEQHQVTSYRHARCYLFIPANRPEFVAKAGGLDADVIIVDLEDSVPGDDKDKARMALPGIVAELRERDKQVAVRINGDLEHLAADLQALPLADLHSVFLPKTQEAGVIRMICQYLNVLEARRSLTPGVTALTPQIESCKGVLDLREIAAASPRIKALAIGSEDLAAELGAMASPDSLLAACQQMALVAGERRIDALGLPGSIGEFKDLDSYAAHLAKAKALGFSGALCVHPSQIPCVNRAFTYSEEQKQWAQRVVSTMAQAEQQGHGAANMDGRMLDAPVVALARRILARD